MPAAAWLAPAPALPRSNIVTVARPASRQAMPSPTTPAPMTATCGFLPIWGSFVVRSGSLRWHDPDRFDGFDLSRPFQGRVGTPGRNSKIMGDLAPFHKAGSGPP